MSIQVTLDGKEFLYGGIRFSTENVVSVSACQVVHLLPLAVDYHYAFQISCRVAMQDGTQLEISREQGRPIFDGRQAEDLEDALQRLLRITFQQRLRPFEESIDRAEASEYAGWRFRPAEGRIEQIESGSSFLVSRSRFLRHFNLLQIVAKGESRRTAVSRWFKERASQKMENAIPTFQDADVFYFLLNRYFDLDLSWAIRRC